MSERSIAVVGSGIAGLSAAWLLSKHHDVTVLEADPTLGGHSNTIDVDAEEGSCPVDTGFIVYNPPNYPNLVALFDHLGVATKPTRMSFAASFKGGDYEYCGRRLNGIFGQRANLLKPSHWRLLIDLIRFFRTSVAAVDTMDADLTLRQFLERGGYSRTFIDKHLMPMAVAIWSTPGGSALDFPAKAFVRFFNNHGLLKLANRPQWRTVDGGAREYVARMRADGGFKTVLDCKVTAIDRSKAKTVITDANGVMRPFDDVVLAVHGDQALAMLGDADALEEDILGAFSYTENLAVVHSDPLLMPRRKALWSSWNYIERGGEGGFTVTYWMNCLQSLPIARDVFVTLNPDPGLALSGEITRIRYRHPMFNASALTAQKRLWALQGRRRTWFCGSYFGSGFHEDGLQSGLAVAEALGGVERPWRLADPSSRIFVPAGEQPVVEAAA